eukprot:264608-Prorocentrum_lima.AAC.1
MGMPYQVLTLNLFRHLEIHLEAQNLNTVYFSSATPGESYMCIQVPASTCRDGKKEEVHGLVSS